MGIWLYWILTPTIAYFIGSIPFGIIISQCVANIDITQRGSGNMGATNVAREIGIQWGLLTLLLDLIKGFFPVYIVNRYFNSMGEVMLFTVCLAALLGHQFSLFRRFNGGKGVATAWGIFLAVSPGSAGIALGIFIIVVIVSDFVSLGSMIASCAMPVILLLFKKSDFMIITSLIMAGLICIRHRDNLKRILNGKESGWRRSLHDRRSRSRSNSSSE
jgi:glycerol-3-phosphate acyltransferase PlsY